MPKVHFYLKKPEGKPARSLIYLQFKYKGRRLVYSVGQKVNPLDWSREGERIRSNRETILNGLFAFNEYLDQLRDVCLQCYREESLKGVPPLALLRYRLDAFVRHRLEGKPPETPLIGLLDEYIAGKISPGGKPLTPAAIRNYITTKGHLLAFVIAERFYLDLEQINPAFGQRYSAFLRETLKLSANSIVRDLGVVKTLMREAVARGYTANMQWRLPDFGYAGEVARPVLLSVKELIMLYHCDLSDEKRLEQVRDLFVLAGLLGLPYMELSLLRGRQVVGSGDEEIFYIPQAKGRGGVLLPGHPVATDILKKYEGKHRRFPRLPSNQKFNDYIKEACYWAGLTARGRQEKEPEKELWQHISSQTARRSFAANYHREGYPVHELMKITGHLTLHAFRNFIGNPAVGRYPDEQMRRLWQVRLLKALTLLSGNKYSR